MNEANLRTMAQVKAFLTGTQLVDLRIGDGQERYDFINRTLTRFSYRSLCKGDKGVIRAYLARVSGYSAAQLSRLISACANKACDQVLRKAYKAPRTAYRRKYTPQDVLLLADTDSLYEGACGSTVAAVMRRQYAVYGEERFARLSQISVSHLYNLRASKAYQTYRTHLAKTKPTQRAIGQRKAPQPQGQAGYIRVDSVHQGDVDKSKGVYHITLVDSVTQWCVVSCVQGISEAFLLDTLEQAMMQVPFVIYGFHSDNGSEYINKRVARLLEKLRIEQTKSRPRHSNDNALAESKNNSIVRKHMGYEHIPKQFAKPINHFYQQTFNPWVNYHRPCLYATEIIDQKGKIRKKYAHKDTQTPLEKLTALCTQNKAVLKAGITLKSLYLVAMAQTDLEATQQMKRERNAVFESIFKTRKSRCTATATGVQVSKAA